MIVLLRRLKQKLLYQFYYKRKLGYAGVNVTLFEPIRIDGLNNVYFGDRVSIQRNTWLYTENMFGVAEPLLEIGQESILGYNNHITAVKSVKIGKNVLTANNVYIADNSHQYDDINTPIMHQKVIFLRETSIGDGSWLGENVCVIGAKVGRNCVIGANSVVTKDIPDYCIAMGNPAQIIRRL